MAIILRLGRVMADRNLLGISQDLLKIREPILFIPFDCLPKIRNVMKSVFSIRFQALCFFII